MNRNLLWGVLGAAFLNAVAACAQPPEVAPGMSRAEVVEILGEPTRKAVLDGKLLREVEELPAGEGPGQPRFVYFYDASGLQVWFKDEVVTGVVRDGVSGG